jgi:hypothetical protein
MQHDSRAIQAALSASDDNEKPEVKLKQYFINYLARMREAVAVSSGDDLQVVRDGKAAYLAKLGEMDLEGLCDSLNTQKMRLTSAENKAEFYPVLETFRDKAVREKFADIMFADELKKQIVQYEQARANIIRLILTLNQKIREKNNKEPVIESANLLKMQPMELVKKLQEQHSHLKPLSEMDPDVQALNKVIFARYIESGIQVNLIIALDAHIRQRVEQGESKNIATVPEQQALGEIKSVMNSALKDLQVFIPVKESKFQETLKETAEQIQKISGDEKKSPQKCLALVNEVLTNLPDGAIKHCPVFDCMKRALKMKGDVGENVKEELRIARKELRIARAVAEEGERIYSWGFSELLNSQRSYPYIWTANTTNLSAEVIKSSNGVDLYERFQLCRAVLFEAKKQVAEAKQPNAGTSSIGEVFECLDAALNSEIGDRESLADKIREAIREGSSKACAAYHVLGSLEKKVTRDKEGVDFEANNSMFKSKDKEIDALVLEIDGIRKKVDKTQTERLRETVDAIRRYADTKDPKGKIKRITDLRDFVDKKYGEFKNRYEKSPVQPAQTAANRR